MEDIDFRKIEEKWQKKWEKEKVFEAKEDKRKKKFYVLEMYPYPSGSGLHMGHAFNYIIGDILARFKRMQGFNVLHPMGYDSFGLPAENAAIKDKTHPKKYTDRAISNFVKQQKSLGLSYDWNRILWSHNPEYYKWNQWIFLKMFKKGLAYRKKSSVNWCPRCDTVLANEQVHNGKCWRHENTDVELKNLEQWFVKTTDYADELLEMVDDLDWPERIKTMQKNWIGKSHGTEIDFEIEEEKWPVFTTRPDTLFGVTFLVVSAQHPKLFELVSNERKKDVEKFLKKVKSVSEKDQNKFDKEGVFTGNYAVNPVNGEKVPIWVGNFVVADYGSGMVMAVPAHDQRDFKFAEKYNIPIKVVVEPKDHEIYERNGQISEAYTGDGTLVNSGDFDGIESKEAKEKITRYLEKKSKGRKSVQYKMRDWLISRQRYWGTPIPIIYCDDCGAVPVPEKDLPVLLPEKVEFGKGNPLETNKKFLEVNCPKCGNKNARRETDTMDTFFDSSWYFLRFTDPKNKKSVFNKSISEYWMPIDFYTGGAEHACMHLIYARFFTKFLRDIGLVSIDEPFKKLFNQGMVHGSDGFVMSKSRGNVVVPEEISKKYGIDTARLFLMSNASPDKDKEWSEEGIEGSYKFVKKIVDYFSNTKIGKSGPRVLSKINKTIKEVSEDIENLRYNFAIMKIRNLFDFIYDRGAGKKELEIFVKLICPFVPHMAEEFWQNLGNKGLVVLEKWPEADQNKINEKFEEEEEIVEKTVGDINNVVKILQDKGKKPEKLYLYAIPSEKESYTENIEEIEKRTGLKTEVYAVNEKGKHDPENKSKKVKLGRPGIYVE